MNYVIGGPPGSGKSTYAAERMARGDLLLDVDTLWMSLSGRPMYDKPIHLLRYVLAARDAVVDTVERRAVSGDAYVLTASGNRQVLDDLAERLGAELIVLEVDAATCKQRLDDDSRRDDETDWHGLVDAWWAEYNVDNRGATMNDEREVRVLAQPLELREDGEGRPVIAGYAAVFGEWSVDLGGFVERIQPGAFAPTLEGDVRALWQHDSNYVLGRTTNGTLRLREDERGLAVEITPPETTWAKDALVSLRRGDVSQMSFAFVVAEDRWEPVEAGPARRTVLRYRDLYEVSPVTFPAYPTTSVSARQRAAALRAQADGQAGDDKAAEELTRAREASKRLLRAWFDWNNDNDGGQRDE